MFVAFVLYTSANGYANKVIVPASVVRAEDEDHYEVRRPIAVSTQEEAQAALNEATNPENPFTNSILANGYRTVIVDLSTGTVVSDTTVAAQANSAAQPA